MARPVDRIILVYNGDSGLVALLLDVAKKAAGREECALCELAYSPIGKRRRWVACERRLGLPVEELHRDRIPREWELSRAELPCILGRAGDERPRVLVNRAEIIACHGSIDELERRLLAALAAPAAAVQP